MSRHGDNRPEQPIKTLIKLIQQLNKDSCGQESSEWRPCVATVQLWGESKMCVFTSKLCVFHIKSKVLSYFLLSSKVTKSRSSWPPLHMHFFEQCSHIVWCSLCSSPYKANRCSHGKAQASAKCNMTNIDQGSSLFSHGVRWWPTWYVKLLLGREFDSWRSLTRFFR